MTSSFSILLVELTQQNTPDPCVTTGNETVCNIQRGISLEPGQVLITWWNWGFPNGGVNLSVGTPIEVDGREGRLQVDARGICGGITDRSFVLKVVSPVKDNWTEMDACYSSQDSSVIEAELYRMIESVHWDS